MSRILGIIAIALAAWAGAELYTQGFDGAFGGLFAGLDDPVVSLEDVERVQSLGERVGGHVQSDLDRAHERLGELE